MSEVGLRTALGTIERAVGFDQVRSCIAEAVRLFELLPPEQQLPVLRKAVGKSIRRFRSAATVLSRSRQSEATDEWFRAALSDSDAERRNWIVQVVGNQRLVQFAADINRIIESDSECRDFAVIAAGHLGTDSNCAALVAYAGTLGTSCIPMNLLQAFARFSSASVRPYLKNAFESGTDPHYRVFAAWGLARQNDQEAIRHLVATLDDREDGHPSLPARRAAQALSDLYNWGLDWTPDAPLQAKTRWNAEHIPRVKSST